MNKFLEAKHWQVFIILIIGLITANFEIENQLTLSLTLFLFGVILYMIYPFLIGYFLQKYVPTNTKLNYNFFIINSFIWIVTYMIIMILSDGQGMSFTGLKALAMFYVFFAFIHFLSFPAKTIKTIELGREAVLGEYIGDFFLVLFLPIGIWFIQPRLNKIIEMNKIENSDN